MNLGISIDTARKWRKQFAERVLALQERHNNATTPFNWTYIRDDLKTFLRRLGQHRPPHHQPKAA